MIQIKDKITDYEKYKNKINDWIALKGEEKYLEFVKILEKNSIDITWLNLSSTYRYDKRLLVNIFKYLSFYEEYLRAQVWNAAEETYKKLEKSYFLQLMKKVIELEDRGLKTSADIGKLRESKDAINELRRSVCHNKIMLNCMHNNMDLKVLLTSFKDNLPVNYQGGFVTDINNCTKALNIHSKVKITLT